MRRIIIGFLVLAIISFHRTSASDDPAIRGFYADRAIAQREIEKHFDSVLKGDNLREWMKHLTARPHHTGSPYDKENAHYIADLFRSWGYETQIEEFRVLFPTPKTRVLEMIAPEVYRAELQEPQIAEDPTSDQRSEQLPTYNAYSTDGDVTGELVYVNYGIPRDYEDLEMRGIDVKGKIVIARYGGSWRGIKPKVAAEHGALGCIIYSDPRDDGYYYGDTYPKGGFRNENSVQRGSVMDFSINAGDPLTPFIAATENAKRIRRQDSNSITKIPVLPISYKDALPLLKSLGGHLAPENWRGSLPITYHVGPGPARVHLKLEFNWDLAPVFDIVARMPGSKYPEQWVIRGNHHDGWVNGAADPISGLVTLLEEARAISELAKQGSKPLRTIVFAAWGGEEQGLLGSVEWVEAHLAELQKKAVVYINTDGYARGFCAAGGSQTLEKHVNQVIREVQDPINKIPLDKRLRASYLLGDGSDEQTKKDAKEREDVRLAALGSGSDYTPFLQHAGISSLDLSCGGEDEYGQYHSIYDSFYHYTQFEDPGFLYGVALTRVNGRLTLRIANADVLPFEFGGFSDNINVYVKELKKLTDDLREETERKNWMIENKIYESFFDPNKSFVIPKVKDPVPHLNFAPLENAAQLLSTESEKYQKAYREATSGDKKLSAEKMEKLNELLMYAERTLTRQEGLPGRPWFHHQIYAPGVYTGYAAKALPAVREAIEQRNWKLAEEQIRLTAQTLETFAGEISRARSIVTGS